MTDIGEEVVCCLVDDNSDGRLGEKASPWAERRSSTAAAAVRNDDVLDTIVSILFFVLLLALLLLLIASCALAWMRVMKWKLLVDFWRNAKIKDGLLTSQRFCISMDDSCLAAKESREANYMYQPSKMHCTIPSFIERILHLHRCKDNQTKRRVVYVFTASAGLGKCFGRYKIQDPPKAYVGDFVTVTVKEVSIINRELLHTLYD